MTAQIASTRTARPGRRGTVSLSALAGVGYTAAWIISLSVGAPNPAVAASGRQVVTAFAGHSGPTLTQFALNEGVAAVALAVVVMSVARAASRAGRTRAGQAAAVFGLAAAGISWAQLTLGAWLFRGLVPDRRAATAGTVYHAITRMDGAKMLLLAAMALAIAELARRPGILPDWLGGPWSRAGRRAGDLGPGLSPSRRRPFFSGVRVRDPAADIRLCHRNQPSPPEQRLAPAPAPVP